MEVTATKQIMIILAALVLCLWVPSLAEELGGAEPGEPIGAEGTMPSPTSPSGNPEETIPPSDPPSADPENPVSPEEEPQETPAEPRAGHTDSHRTREIPQEPAYQDNGDGSTHTVTMNFDLYCDDCQQVIEENTRTMEFLEGHQGIEQQRTDPTCTAEGTVEYVCAQCGAAYSVSLPIAHCWSEWEDQSDPEEPVCLRRQVQTRRCQVCGREETLTASAPGHQWEAVSYEAPTCITDGVALRRCRVCGEEEKIVTPALGHTFLPDEENGSKMVCALCGVEEQAEQAPRKMYYNNTVTSFGPTTRELIGGSVWNRVTPVDLSEEGVFTYPLVASNLYTVGTATVINDQGEQVVNYKLSSSKVNVHSESLVVYPNLEALKTGHNAVSFEFGTPIHLEEVFGKDSHVIVAITLKADYDANGVGVQYFLADEQLINEMKEMVD